MALKFKLVMRKNLGEDHESIPEKVYAQMVYGDLVTFDEFTPPSYEEWKQEVVTALKGGSGSYECGVGPSFTAWQACQCR